MDGSEPRPPKVMPMPLEQLRRRIGGRVLTPGDVGFEEMAKWAAIDTRPALVAVPSSAADVAVVALFAASHRLGVSASPTAGAVLVEPSALRRLEIDSDTWIARVEPGVTGEMVLHAAQAFGLAPVLDTEPDRGIVANVVDGGAGWLARWYGLGIDHVRSVELVTADGVIRSASTEENPDLFWAVGAAGSDSVGVITRMDIDLAPVGSVHAGSLHYRPAELERLADRYRRWVEEAPSRLTAALVFDGSSSTAHDPRGRSDHFSVIVRACHLGAERDAEAAVDFWRRWRNPDLDTWRTGPFGAFAAPDVGPASRRRLSSRHWLTELGPDVLASLADLVARSNAAGDGLRIETVQIIDLGPEPDGTLVVARRARSRWCVTLSGSAGDPVDVVALSAQFDDAARLLPLLQPDPAVEQRLDRIQRRLAS